MHAAPTMTIGGVLHEVADVVPWAFVIGSVAFVGWSARRERPAVRPSVAVAVLAIVIGSIWGLIGLSLTALGSGTTDAQRVQGFVIPFFLTLLGGLDAWMLAARRPPAATALLIFFVCVATVPVVTLGALAVEQAATAIEAQSAKDAADKLVSDRSSAMSLFIRDAVVTLTGPIPPAGQAASPVDATMRLHLIIRSTAAIAVDTGTYSYVAVDTSKTAAAGGEPAGFDVDDVPLPATIPVGDTSLDLSLDGGITAGSHLPDPSISWTLVLAFHGPGQTDYRVTTTFQPTIAPIPSP